MDKGRRLFFDAALYSITIVVAELTKSSEEVLTAAAEDEVVSELIIPKTEAEKTEELITEIYGEYPIPEYSGSPDKRILPRVKRVDINFV